MSMLMVFTTLIISPVKTNAESFDVSAGSAILVEVETGKVLFAKDPDMKLPPASMTKMMTEYLVSQALAEGRITNDTQVIASQYAAWMGTHGGSRVYLEAGKPYTVGDLYEGVAVASGNDASVALAEHIAGSETEFVKMMNQKAQEFGMENTHFRTSSGYPIDEIPEEFRPNIDGEHGMSAKDAAILAQKLISDFPETLVISQQESIMFEGIEFDNWNYMVPGLIYEYEGLDGLKTGHTDKAGYCFTGTAERNGTRLISVVMRTESEQARFLETKKLLDYGFSQFSKQELYPEGYQIEGESILPVVKGKEEQVEISTNQPISTVVKNGEAESYSVTYNFDPDLLNEDGALTAPIEKGAKVGTMEVTYNGDIDYGNINNTSSVKPVDIVTTSGIEKANWFVLTIGSIGDFFSNIFKSITDTITGWF
ncbi:D-alanyl-D-alanine carboxypeptidase [Aquibacillus halophilus]|uniref:serine-type D-Ala-D-Ala carboxypeptidase n=2 Tax=Aquibacillus halophilus TaxID=930132 RepID=A0A6A8DKW4_9BACI|nr:D-alanyl-D-alanine carboxypeptidase [Aquibacillus halophilus]